MKSKIAIFGILLPTLFLAGCSAGSSMGSDAVSGTIETDEVHVASRHGGRVETILAREGDNLPPGQVIARLAAPELAARRQYAAAALAELKSGARPEELQAAKSDWEALSAELDFAVAENKRVAELFEKGTTSANEKDRSLARARSLEKSAAAAKSRLDLLKAGARAERIEQAEALLAEIETQLRELEISSPTNAVLETLHVKPGDVLVPNREIATLLLSSHLWLRVYVPAPWVGRIKLGQQVSVIPDSAPDKRYQGEVEQIGRAAEFTPRNVQTVEERVKQVFGIKVRLNNGNGDLRAGMSARVVFPGLPTGNAK